MAGNNIFCLDTARPTEIEELITSTDDGDLLEKVLDEELPNQRPALLEAAREAVSNEMGGMLK